MARYITVCEMDRLLAFEKGKIIAAKGSLMSFGENNGSRATDYRGCAMIVDMNTQSQPKGNTMLVVVISIVVVAIAAGLIWWFMR